MLYEEMGLTFRYNFDSDAASSYLVLEPEKGSRLIGHQAEIICRNPNAAFVSFNIRRENNDIFIYYNITSKISLTQYLDRKKLNRKELLDLLGSITKNLLLHGSYLLDLSSFVLHQDFIFINPATAEASLVYIPFSCNRNSMEVCRDFLKELVVNSANVNDGARDNYMQKILGCLKSGKFNLNEFNKLLAELKYNKGDCEVETSAANEKAISGCMPVEAHVSAKASHGIRDKRRALSTMVLVQFLIIPPVIILCLVLKAKGMGDPVSIAGVSVIGLAADMLAISKLPLKPIEKSNYKLENIKESKPLKQVLSLEAPEVPEVVMACDTVMISEARHNEHPYLEPMGEYKTDSVAINKERFTIGRLDSMVDYVIPDGTIGKLHAEILHREGKYYLMDLNSKNGTYVDGERLVGNKEHQLNDNCRIRFSGYEYIFRL